MTSIPPLSPRTSTTPAPGSATDKRPESVQLLVKVMAAVVGLELVHQLLSAITTILNFDVLQAAARQATESEDQSPLPDFVVQASSWLAFAFSVSIALVIIAVLAWALKTFNTKGKYVAGARRLLFIFSLYFGFRMLLVFLTRPTPGSDAPDWLFALDGVVQILVGVAGIICAILASRSETLDYTGELEKLRELEKEQRKLMEERMKEKKAKAEAKEAKKAEKAEKAEKAKQAGKSDKPGGNDPVGASPGNHTSAEDEK